MAYTPPKPPKPHNPFDTGATAIRQAHGTHADKLREAGGRNASAADVQAGEVTDLGVESSYIPGSLIRRAGEIAAGLALAAQGEEGLEPQTA